MFPGPIRRRTPALGALLTAAVAAGTTSACSSAGHDLVRSSPPPVTVPGRITLDEHAAGTTVRVRTGTAVLVELHSTYWSTPASSDPRVLAPGPGGGSSPAATCRPGAGCGVSLARFTTGLPGTVHITARRSSCGEAMRCSPGQDRYDVTVAVTG
ncbi:hypothetical protein [Peterkaempfera griseoplana]|uniref:hypothetical protein n=1 Tax=Peterkaempfera griseoplana TaxID=66896 RepID=UPI0006E26B38|nr:hypothetical protein [Peterkaempfera griseoplana]